MSPYPRTLPSRAALVMVAIVLTGATACGQSSTDGSAANDVATLSDGDAASEANGDPLLAADAVEAPADPDDAFALFQDCLDDAGFGGGGLVVGGSGDQIDIDQGPINEDADPQSVGSVDDFDFAEFEEATEICEAHLANVGFGFDMTPEEEAIVADAQLAFADCMESQGIDIPDLAGGGAITIESEAEVDPQTGAIDFDDIDFEEFEEAAQECQHVFDEVDEIVGAGGPGE